MLSASMNVRETTEQQLHSTQLMYVQGIRMDAATILLWMAQFEDPFEYRASAFVPMVGCFLAVSSE